MKMNRNQLRLNFYIAVVVIVFLSCGYPDGARQNKKKAEDSSPASASNDASDKTAVSSDPVIRSDARGAGALEIASEDGKCRSAVLHRIPAFRCYGI